MNNLNIFSVVSVTVSIVMAVLSFINVNRQKTASLINDQEKFVRELNLKTNDEVIDNLFNLLEILKNYRTLDTSYKFFQGNEKEINKEFNEKYWNINRSFFSQIFTIESIFLKRNIILKKHLHDFNILKASGLNADKYFWDIKTRVDRGSNLKDIIQEVRQAQIQAEEVINQTENLIIKIQNDFMGHLYKQNNARKPKPPGF
ncbi:hypothetical protein [Cohnella sp. GCM10012308]|uniref:hypothetical protein n=1 Tax=Cohnella sp. GCM10012308 TaxID=3317329 RepID=UPI00360A6364